MLSYWGCNSDDDSRRLPNNTGSKDVVSIWWKEKESNFMYNTRLNNDSNNPIMHASVTFTDFGSGIIQ